ncbi:DUF2652 domain-containing protein [Poritiphilus flavus]|uniref:DUF2652 domain-containing protein n=1 Tax=Poritiphilus flavus TaxID=2697053 RepID=A0A6L9E7Z4_9FLAO|nr:DUF2652 domain-containing protein [Poritiphilus flavus]NAS10728.1 DUF2652 domain-containing protein [Poritiphilus flavus]
MSRSLLFIPDISGFTKFVQTTEIAHSQHVISELLEVLIDANTQRLRLAEIEGDALFFYKEDAIPSQEKLLAQIETMFTAFYSHLKLLETNRICPCNACATAPDLELKIVAHSSELNFIEVRGQRKPFGPQVIEAHRLLKNSVQSDNYALISKALAEDVGLTLDYSSKIFGFESGQDNYDNSVVEYLYAIIDQDQLNLRSFEEGTRMRFEQEADLVKEADFTVSAAVLMEYITNYTYRHHWVQGVDKFEFNENEVTRIGTEHICVINGKHLNFVTVTKEAEPGELVYGEMSTSLPIVDTVYQFYTITPRSSTSCRLKTEVYWEARSVFKKLAIALFGKRVFKKNLDSAINGLATFVNKEEANN